MRLIPDLESLTSSVGSEVGVSEWLAVGQREIDAFADVTGDHQWIHVDQVRALAGPYGGTIAHGFLVLSLIPALSQQVLTFPDRVTRVNYGLDRVRFLSPVPSGSRVRDRLELTSAEPSREGQLISLRHTIELEHAERPACVAQSLSLVLGL